MKPSEVQQLRELVGQLGLLIECADRLPTSQERDAALGEIIYYRDRLNAITGRKADTDDVGGGGAFAPPLIGCGRN